MSLVCTAWLPLIVCRHQQQLLYLAPSLVLALLIHRLAARHPLFFLFTLAGTLCHELTHFLVGFLCGAHPTQFTVIPRRSKHGWELGSVLLTRVRWYNAAPAALAPLALVALPWLVAAWRVHPGWRFGALDCALAVLLAPQWLSLWPSRLDWAIAARSWPALLLAILLWCAWTRWFSAIL